MKVKTEVSFPFCYSFFSFIDFSFETFFFVSETHNGQYNVFLLKKPFSTTRIVSLQL